MDRNYYIPYKTGEEMLALKDDLIAAKKRILAAYPNFVQDYAERTAYSKYSKENSLRVLIPSAIVDYSRIPKVIDKLPKNKNTDIYREYVYDTSGNMLITNYVLKEKFRDEIFYIVDFEGYRYLINYPEKITDRDIIFRLKFENNKLVLWEDYSSRHGLYYSEVYYSIGTQFYCTTEFMQYKYENESELLKEIGEQSLLIQTKYENDKHLQELSRQSFARLVESIENDKKEHEEGIKLPATDKRSIVNLSIYELTYKNDFDALEQVDEINLTKGTKRTVYSQKPKNSTDLLKTRQSIKRLKDRLSGKSYSAKGLTFADFWSTFKEFAINDKFDCADDSILWEPLNSSIHIARQFVRQKADGEYQGIEQLNIDFDFSFTQSSSFAGAFWSDNDIEEFFEKVEQTDEFKSIDPKTEIVPTLIFNKV